MRLPLDLEKTGSARLGSIGLGSHSLRKRRAFVNPAMRGVDCGTQTGCYGTRLKRMPAGPTLISMVS